MQNNCSSDPTNPTANDCVCPSYDLSSCSDSTTNSRTAQGPNSVVNAKGVVGKFCQSILKMSPPVCDKNSKEPCMCPVGSSVDADSNGGYYCKNNN
jgi:hypothetical protein